MEVLGCIAHLNGWSLDSILLTFLSWPDCVLTSTCCCPSAAGHSVQGWQQSAPGRAAVGYAAPPPIHTQHCCLLSSARAAALCCLLLALHKFLTRFPFTSAAWACRLQRWRRLVAW